MIFRQLFDRDSYTYTYLLADKKTRHALLIDPVESKVSDYLQLLKELDVILKLALDTHTHADHISAIGPLREQTGCISMLGKESGSKCVSDTFTDGDTFSIGEIELEVLYTPGHTDDSYSFKVQRQQQTYLFTGDTLLIRGSGRTDFQSGNAHIQYQSLTQKLLNQGNDAIVYPGHDYRGFCQSTIGEEKANNPRLQVKSADEYAEIMNNLNLPNPKLMDIAIPVNRACGKV